MQRASVILVLQNNLHFADLSLVSLEMQSTHDFELLIVADYASSDVIRTVQTRLPLLNIPARLIWASEAGATPSREQLIVHTALRCLDSGILIFCDSSMILHPRFVEEHVRNCVKGQVLSARRVELSSHLSGSLRTEDIRRGWLQSHYSSVVLDGIFGQSTHVSRGFYVRSTLVRRLLSSSDDDIYASNFSVHYDDAVKLRDFIDGSFELNRASLSQHAGLNIRRLRNVIIQYHLQESGESPIRIAAGVMERVKRLRYRVGEFGLQPAMLEAQRSGRPR